MKRVWVISLAVAAFLAWAAPAWAAVRLVAVTSPASPGGYATLKVAVSQSATCSITVNDKSGPSRAQGLYPEKAVGGRVSWMWMVGTRTTPGRWGISVLCGAARSLNTSFVVR